MVDHAHCTLETVLAKTMVDRSFPTQTPAAISMETGLVCAVSDVECRAGDQYEQQKRQWIDSFVANSARKVGFFFVGEAMVEINV